MNNGETLLTTQGLTVGYQTGKQQNRLFEGLNLSLDSGEMVCFMGPNGAGKSSLLRTLAGLQPSLAGEVRLHVGSEDDDRSKQIAVVLTDRINTVNLTVKEIVAFGRYPYVGWNVRLTEYDRQVIEASVARVHIQHLLERKVFELSDGQLQLVMIARALAQDTPVLLLDEPTAHLDLNNRVEVMNLLRSVCRTAGKSILMATHELDLALQTADRIWLTGGNKDVLAGLPEDLVLNGSFDDIFQFKGFDLKTGKVLHSPFRETMVQLTGEGAPYLWTRNALERNGFGVTTEDQRISVTLEELPEGLKWMIARRGSVQEADSIEQLIALILENDCEKRS